MRTGWIPLRCTLQFTSGLIENEEFTNAQYSLPCCKILLNKIKTISARGAVLLRLTSSVQLCAICILTNSKGSAVSSTHT